MTTQQPVFLGSGPTTSVVLNFLTSGGGPPPPPPPPLAFLWASGDEGLPRLLPLPRLVGDESPSCLFRGCSGGLGDEDEAISMASAGEEDSAEEGEK